jgi:hypothetical protein
MSKQLVVRSMALHVACLLDRIAMRYFTRCMFQGVTLRRARQEAYHTRKTGMEEAFLALVTVQELQWELRKSYGWKCADFRRDTL